MKNLVVAVFILGFFTACSILDPFSKESIQKAQISCVAGSGSACHTVAVDYAKNKNDYENAAKFFNKACGLGYEKSCYNLGVLYLNSKGVSQNLSKAKKLFENSCKSGIGESCYHLGLIYQKALGVKQDYSMAREFFEKSCDKGYGAACSSLGELYRDGIDFRQDYEKALTLFKKACDKKSLNGCYNLAYANEFAQGVSLNLDKAKDIYDKACQGGNIQSCKALASMFISGKLEESDEIQKLQNAAKFTQMACDFGDNESCKTAQMIEKTIIDKQSNLPRF